MKVMTTISQRPIALEQPPATLAINERSKQLERMGKVVYKLGFGQSPFPIPEEVVQALKEHAHKKDYLPSLGLPELRTSVANYYQRQYNLEVLAEQVMIGAGSKELIFFTQLASRYNLLLPQPSWVSYEPQAALLGNKVYWIQTQQKEGWKLNATNLEEAASQIEGNKLLILNYPNNPVGNSYNEAELEAIAVVAKRHNLLIISDEIYSALQFEESFKSLAHFYPEGTIISSGLSKWCGAGGWRLGTFVFPKKYQWLQQKMSIIASETFSCVAAPIQYAAIKAFDGSPAIEQYVLHSKQILQCIAYYVHAKLNTAKLYCPKAEGGFYFFVSFEHYRPYLQEQNIYTSQELCRYLLDNFGIALLPSDVFGLPKKTLSVRLSYVDFEAKALLDHLQRGGQLDTSPRFIQQHFPKIYNALELLVNWLMRNEEINKRSKDN